MRRWLLLAASLLISSGAAVFADDTITVTATSADISAGLDLKAVANLFGEVKDLEEFEKKLNSDSLHLCNLDLNGDGQVDYLRVVETTEKEEKAKKHTIVLQAVLAKDIYQDVATIYVENNDKNEALVKLIGDKKIYGDNYVIEPVYIYRPVIYDWFWGPNWACCYTSPWYWGYWPGWYAPYPCWGYSRYWTHVYVYHYDHPRCSYHYSREAHAQATQMRNYSSRPDRAVASTSASSSRATSSRPSYTTTRYSSSSGSSSSRESSSYSGSSSSRGSSYSSGSSSSRGSSSSSSSRGSSSYTPSYSSSSSSSRGSSYSSGSSSSRGSSSYSSGSSSRGSSSYGGGGSYSGGGSSSGSRR